MAVRKNNPANGDTLENTFLRALFLILTLPGIQLHLTVTEQMHTYRVCCKRLPFLWAGLSGVKEERFLVCMLTLRHL